MNKIIICVGASLLFNLKVLGQNKNDLKQVEEANKWNSEQFVVVKRNFAFLASCDTSEIKTTILQTMYEKDKVYYENPRASKTIKKMKAGAIVRAQTIGVSGCGKKATYVLDRDAGWILNGTVK